MANPPETIIVPPTVNDTTEQMENFLKANSDNTPKSRAMQDALAQVKTNLDNRKTAAAE